MESIALESLTFEQLMLFAMDNGFGVPEDGDLHGQNKQEVRQSLLAWLEKRMGSGNEAVPKAFPSEGKVAREA